MKKIISLTLASILLSGCQVFDYFKDQPPTTTSQEPSSIPSNQQSPLDLTSTSQEATQERPITESSIQPNERFLDEKVVGQSDYPPLSFPAQTPADINEAMATYYQANFSQTEQTASSQQIDEAELDQVLEAIKRDPELNKLNVAIDQVTMTLNGNKIFLPRIIVPSSYQVAEETVKENDTRLLNQALTLLGNRLVLLAYYDETSDQVVPMHLVNSTKSIFYFEPR